MFLGGGRSQDINMFFSRDFVSRPFWDVQPLILTISLLFFGPSALRHKVIKDLLQIRLGTPHGQQKSHGWKQAKAKRRVKRLKKKPKEQGPNKTPTKSRQMCFVFFWVSQRETLKFVCVCVCFFSFFWGETVYSVLIFGCVFKCLQHLFR